MILRISSLYAEPGTYFDFSYKIIRLFEKSLNEDIMKPYGLDKKSTNQMLSLIITTKKECSQTNAKGPDWDEKNKCLTWGLWLPYNKIVKDPNSTKMFVFYFFQAAGMVFSNYGVKVMDVTRLEQEVFKEVQANNFYAGNETVDMSVDLSKIKF